ncbi:A/G-specific adenine glycosylase [Oceanospirillum sanctuarii]|uniref:A/G-specific adenine glycosylase n=1 Tax=Oceanospirillum sanctuarii TaxID=1434821 RepID=UPI001FEB6805|nr:A/G-specific adenine glycosylase [Oceanospirillum sanctuarii]
MDLSVKPHTAELISTAILDWYDENGRKSLPWQQERTAYKVWLSEVMLQQTQVATVIPYFEAFIDRFPTIEALAKAHIDEVLHLWTGLGYYARARNLHKCAQTITENYQGKFPEDQAALEALPGIGRSTAAAIIAQTFDKPAAILDGNVKRLLARLHCVPGWPGQSQTLKALWQLAEHYTPPTRCQAYTQAVMDMGAMVCTRRNPKCDLCPIEKWCAARSTASQHDFPNSKPKKTNPVRQSILFVLQTPDGNCLLLQRPPTGIWGGLWSLPDASETEGLLDALPHKYDAEKLEHKFSHFTLEAEIRICHLNKDQLRKLEQNIREERHRWYNPQQPDSIGLPGPIHKLLHR